MDVSREWCVASRIRGRVRVCPFPPSSESPALVDFVRVLVFFTFFKMSFKGSLPRRRLSFDREILRSLASLLSSLTRVALPTARSPVEEPSGFDFSEPGRSWLGVTIESGSRLALSPRWCECPTIFLPGFTRHIRAEPATTRVTRVVATRRRGSLLKAGCEPSCSPPSIVLKKIYRDVRQEP